MYSEKRNMRGIKRKLTDKDEEEEDQLFNKAKTKLKDDIDTLIDDNLTIIENNNLLNDETDKENSELKIDFLNNNDTSLNDILNSTNYLTQNELNTKLDDELTKINELDELNNNDNQLNNEFNSFLNTSLNNYVNSRPLTPLPQFDSSQQKPHHEQSINDQIQPQSSNQSTKENLSPLNSFTSLIPNNTKLFNSTSSSLFNAAAIIDTYFSSSTKKSKLEKAKNMNHFRYSLFNKSLAKLNKFCNSSDPNIRNSVLVCNTLKRLERQLRKENIYLHLGSNGLAFVKLKNKRSNPEQLDYRNLILDETSHIYVEKNDNEDDNEQQEDENDDKFGIDDFCFATQQQTSSDSDELTSSEELDDEDDDEDNKLTNNLTDNLTNNLTNEQISTDTSMCNNSNTYLSTAFESSLINNNRINLTEWTNDDENNLDNNWTNMLTNLTSNQTDNLLNNNEIVNDQQIKDNNQFNSNYLFNSDLEQNVDQTNLTTTDEIFNDIDSLITLYDFDLSTNSTKIEQKDELNSLKCSNSQENSNLFLIDSTDSGAIELNLIQNSLNDSINSPINNSLQNSNNNLSTCSTSISVNSSSASYSSNHQSNNTISVISSRV